MELIKFIDLCSGSDKINGKFLTTLEISVREKTKKQRNKNAAEHTIGIENLYKYSMFSKKETVFFLFIKLPIKARKNKPT